MQMIPVSSSDLAAVGYAGTTLWISFHSGGLYEYSGVPQSVYESLMNAPSNGKYFHAHIKRSYPYRNWLINDHEHNGGAVYLDFGILVGLCYCCFYAFPIG